MKITKDTIIGDIVANDYRAASVFKAHNIDFCCNGNRSIATVCEADKVEITTLIAALNQAKEHTEKTTSDFNTWDIDLLADYIEKKHHRYINDKHPELQSYLTKISKVHGDRHPELLKIEELFKASTQELVSHMQEEEKVLFPYVRKMADKLLSGKPSFGTIQNPIETMMHEHDTEGERFRKIAALSNNYTPPADACSTYKVAFKMLKEFEDDLHLHIHLENNILFPKAIEGEKKLSHA